LAGRAGIHSTIRDAYGSLSKTPAEAHTRVLALPLQAK